MSSPNSKDVPSYMKKCWEGDTVYYVDTRLETWDDPTPRESEFTIDDLVEAFVEAGRKHFSLRAKYTRPTSEEQVRQREEDDRNSAMIALEVYIKKNNMQRTDLEFVELKESNFIDECAKGYLHLNFLVKGSDGKHTMFFAEVQYNLKDERDVYLCMPLGDDDFNPSKKNDQGRCKGCLYRARNLVHPSCGSFLGGHRYIAWPYQDTHDVELDEEIS